MGKKAALIVLMLLVMSSPTVLPVHAETHVLTVPDDYLTIQAAVSQAHDGDTIHVKSGQYSGSVTIEKSLSLIADQGAVITDWVLNGRAVILITHSNVTVKGFTIDNPSINTIWNPKRGIHLLGADNCTITNNTIRHSDYGAGIWLYQANNNLIIDNYVSNSGTGISLGHSADNKIINNTLGGNSQGIAVSGQSYDNQISGNKLSKDDLGITISESYRNQFFDNDISASSQFGVQFGDVYNEAGGAENNSFYHNNFFDNSGNVESYQKVGVNYFDNGKQGNYYSNRGGQDLNGDGIIDTPFTIVTAGADFTDNYPLARPWIGDIWPPLISFLSPTMNATYSVGSVDLNFTVNEETRQIKFSLDSSESTTLSSNTTLTGLANGNHTITVYATDLAGNLANKTVIFSVAAPVIQNNSVSLEAIVGILAIIIVVIGVLLVRKKIKQGNY